MNTPLQLDNHFYTKISVTSDPQFGLSKTGDEKSFVIGWKIEIQSPIEADKTGTVQLEIKIGPYENKQAPYQINLTVLGFFSISPDIPDDKVRNLLRINGGSILYSSAREFLFSITARAPYGPVYLPTIRILPEDIKNEPEISDEQQADPGKIQNPKKRPTRKGKKSSSKAS